MTTVTAMESEGVLCESAVRVSTMFCMFSFRDLDRRRQDVKSISARAGVSCAHYKTRGEVVKEALWSGSVLISVKAGGMRYAHDDDSYRECVSERHQRTVKNDP